MKSNEETKLTSKIETESFIESRLTALGGLGVEESGKKM